MKTIIYIVGFSFLFACTKQESKPGQNAATPSSQGVAQVEKMDEPDQRLAFNLLTLDEKVALASQHIDFCLGYFALDPNQKASLTRAKAGLRNIYSSTDGSSAEMATLILDINQYFLSLDNKTLTVLFDSMAASDGDVQAIAPVNPNVPRTNCTCSSASNYCSSSSWGIRIPCDTKCTNVTTWGCGTLWGYSCNGRCSMI